jgi:hypothetical protein
VKAGEGGWRCGGTQGGTSDWLGPGAGWADGSGDRRVDAGVGWAVGDEGRWMAALQRLWGLGGSDEGTWVVARWEVASGSMEGGGRRRSGGRRRGMVGGGATTAAMLG